MVRLSYIQHYNLVKIANVGIHITTPFKINLYCLSSARHREQERRMETIIRENTPTELGEDVIKCKFINISLSLNRAKDLIDTLIT